MLTHVYFLFDKFFLHKLKCLILKDNVGEDDEEKIGTNETI